MTEQDMEVIELMSDEDPSEESGKKDKSKTCNTNCINFKCRSGVNMKPAPSFACSYYGITAEKRKKKKRIICKECFDAALEHQKVYSLACNYKIKLSIGTILLLLFINS